MARSVDDPALLIDPEDGHRAGENRADVDATVGNHGPLSAIALGERRP